MKVKKELIGRYVELVWKDPIGMQRQPVSLALRGLSGLAQWAERGVLDDIHEGIVRVVHSAGANPGQTVVDEISYTLVPEDLIVSITVLEPVKEAQ